VLVIKIYFIDLKDFIIWGHNKLLDLYDTDIGLSLYDALSEHMSL
jgi:hypothetical protein